MLTQFAWIPSERREIAQRFVLSCGQRVAGKQRGRAVIFMEDYGSAGNPEALGGLQRLNAVA
jgi:hypothetical protein